MDALTSKVKTTPHRNRRLPKDSVDFSKVGGLDHHLKTLRDLIFFPLLHGNVFTHFNIKAPRGVLFYGPPGTGKTLVAGALATEMNKEGIAKVALFEQKGADILDKWIGESEKKLRALFEKAAKNRPAIIFFDELDGLAPIRSQKNEHIHSSIVATLLSLMDGLEKKPGIIVIGATNRIDAIDPALRRTGRFDKELYFPLPSLDARIEIIKVHTSSWKYKPTGSFLYHLAEITGGFCGSDLQALCTEAVVCCMKRNYPSIQDSGVQQKLDPESLKVEECDFLEARSKILPSTVKHGQKMRSLSVVIKPLFERQLIEIMDQIHTMWPHFLKGTFNFINNGSSRYAGRIVLIASCMKGLNSHLVPAILQNLEHLPVQVFDVHRLLNRETAGTILLNFPSVLLLSRIDEWWNLIKEYEQVSIVSALEEIPAEVPILTIATCRKNIPHLLRSYFCNHSSILMEVEDPTPNEKEEFFAPLFFDEKIYSLFYSLKLAKDRNRAIAISESGGNDFQNAPASSKSRTPMPRTRFSKRKKKMFKELNELSNESNAVGECSKINTSRMLIKRKTDPSEYCLVNKRIKFCEDQFGPITKPSDLLCTNTDSMSSNSHKTSKKIKKEFSTSADNEDDFELLDQQQKFINVFTNLMQYKNKYLNLDEDYHMRNYMIQKLVKTENTDKKMKSIEVVDENNSIRCIYKLWKRTSLVTSKNMHVAQLELLYDIIAACINIYRESFQTLIKCLEDTLDRIEKCCC